MGKFISWVSQAILLISMGILIGKGMWLALAIMIGIIVFGFVCAILGAVISNA